MANVFEYTDYRKFLRDRIVYLKMKKKKYTYRYIAKEVGFKSAGYLTQVIQGKSKLSHQMIMKFADVLSLKKREANYFELMVHYNQAKTHEKKKHFFRNMIGYKKGRARTLDPDEYEFYDHWYYSAIRAIFNYYSFKDDYKKLAAMVVPRITVAEARKAIAVLLKLGLIVKDNKGSYFLTSKHVTTGFNSDSIIINNFVLNTIDIAKDAFYRFAKEDRSFSALTLSVSKNGYDTIKNRVDAFRKELVDIVQNDSGIDRVCQVNFQLFPLTSNTGGKKE